MQITLNVVLTPDELKAGAIAQARAAAAAAVSNDPVAAGSLTTAACTTDIQASGASTFSFVVSAPAAADAAKA